MESEREEEKTLLQKLKLDLGVVNQIYKHGSWINPPHVNISLIRVLHSFPSPLISIKF